MVLLRIFIPYLFQIRQQNQNSIYSEVVEVENDLSLHITCQIDKGEMEKSTRYEADNVALEASALAYFRHQRKLPGTKGKKSKQSHSGSGNSHNIPSLVLPYTEYFDRVTNNNDDHDPFYLSVTKPVIPRDVHHSQYYDWLNTLVAGQNILVYGPGDQSQHLSNFAELFLSGEDCIELNGAAQITSISSETTVSSQALHYVSESRSGENAWPKALKGLLEVIVKDILCLSSSKNNELLLPDDPSLLCLTFSRLAERLDAHYGRINAMSSASQHANTNISGNHSNVSHNATHVVAPLQQSLFQPRFTRGQSLSSSLVASSSSSTSHPHHHSANSLLNSNNNVHNRGRYAHNQTRLFLVLHHLDGALLSHPQAQQCLSALLCSTSVSLLASVSCLNTPLLWSPLTNAAFHFRYFLNPTYHIGHVLPRDLAYFGQFHFNHQQGTSFHANQHEEEIVSADVLVTVLQTVDSGVKELLRLLCRSLCDKQPSLNSSDESETPLRSNEMTLHKMLTLAENKLLVKTREELLLKMRELFDTRLLQLTTTSKHPSKKSKKQNGNSNNNKKTEILRVMLSQEDIRWIAGETHQATAGSGKTQDTAIVGGNANNAKNSSNHHNNSKNSNNSDSDEENETDEDENSDLDEENETFSRGRRGIKTMVESDEENETDDDDDLNAPKIRNRRSYKSQKQKHAKAKPKNNNTKRKTASAATKKKRS